MKVFIGGVNGSGKTTIINKFIENNPKYFVADSKGFSHWLGFGGDYEKLRALDPPDRDLKLDKFVREILRRNGDILFGFHYLNIVRGVVTKTTGDWIKNFDALILVNTDFEILWQRISTDERDRALFVTGTSETEAKNILESYQKRYKDEFWSLSQKYDLPAFEITNHLLEESVSEFKKTISQLE